MPPAADHLHTSPTARRRRGLVWTVCLGLMLLASAALAAPPPAGTQIDNTANGSFIDAASGLNVHVQSNTVSVFVQPIEVCTLTPGQTVTRAPGAAFALPHVLGNAGNTPEVCELDLQLLSGNTFSPVGPQVVEDLNGNGVVDPGEPVLVNGIGGSPNPGTGVSLNPGASVALLVVGAVPPAPGAQVGQSASLQLNATSAVQLQHVSAQDTVVVTTGPSITVTKSATPSNPVQGGNVTYALSETNIGDAAALGTPVLVDGNSVNLVVLRDAIPANTSFQSLGVAGASQPLFHLLGQPVNSYVSVPPAGATVDAIGWGVPSLAAGATLTGQFTVKVAANAAGTLDNIGYVDYQSTGPITVPSNPVSLPLPALPAGIAFYPDGNYTTPVGQSLLGVPLFVQVNAAACNVNGSQIESYPVRLNTAIGDDVETYTAVETGPNTGIFRIQPDVPTADGSTHPVVTGDGILEVFQNDTVTATLLGCAAAGQISSTILIDPRGVVFDSKTNQPVAGASVTLIDVTGGGNGGSPGAAAAVFAPDGVTPAPSTVVTGGDGAFVFPFVKPSTYALRVLPPAGYLFPSKLPPALQPVGRNVIDPGSYGGNFVLAGDAPIRIDVPLDPGATGGLIVQKTASKTVVEVGDFLDYTVTVSNHSGLSLDNVIVTDWLPPGFQYIRGSTRIGGQLAPDPLRVGGALQFAIGTLSNQGQLAIVYRVAIGPGAQSGSGVNSARAQSGTLQSNLATVKVQVLGGVFDNHAVLIGKVFADCNGNRVQDPGEPGIPGVRVWLADGTYAVTDGDGKYSLYGLTPRTTVAAVDKTTLPPGASLEVLDHRNALDPSSQFVDLKNGELHKTDFAIGQCDADVIAAIKARRRALDKPEEISRIARNLLSASSNAALNLDARSLPASGTLGPNGVVPDGTSMPLRGTPLGAVGDLGGSVMGPWPTARPVFPNQATTPTTVAAAPIATAPLTPSAAAAAPPAAVPVTPLPDLLQQLDSTVAFIEPLDGQTMASAQTRVRVKGPAGSELRLTVNGKAIDAGYVGTRTTSSARGVTAWEYIGIDLKAGDNTLEVSAVDGFGNARGKASIHLTAPGSLAKLRIVLPDKAVADPQTPVQVKVEALDAAGVPVTSRVAVTLQTDKGIWQETDLNKDEPGTQTFIEGGSASFTLLPPANPGIATIQVKSGVVDAQDKLTFAPFLRPMIAVGLVEAVLDLRKLDPRMVQATDGTEGFERAIQSVRRDFDNGRNSVGGRAQVFLKGKVLGSTLLTLGYDSDKPSDTALFRDIQPTRFYPIYGDSSVKGFDAQSTGKLYVRLDHGTSYLLLGDYSTQTENPARQITQYTRALYGLRAHGVQGGLTTDFFASRTASTQSVVEIPGNGTSGPYHLDPRGVVNSQQVDLIVRDRTQSSVIVSDQPLTPFVDYTIEPISGQLLFAAPVPSVDANLNPVFIRVNYEVVSGGPKHWVYGAAAEWRMSRLFSFGLSGVRDEDPAKPLQLYGADFTAYLGKSSTLVGEFARSNTPDHGTGNAERLEWRGQTDRVQGRIWGIHTDADFQNPSAMQSAGQSQYGAQVGIKLGERDRLVVEGLRTLAPTSNASQTGASVSLQHNFPHDVKLSVGVRHAQGQAQTSIPDPNGSMPRTTAVDFTSGFVRVDAPVPGLPKANVFAQYERAFDENAQVFSFGGTYSLGNLGKLYFRHETSDSLSGAFGLNPAVNQYSTVFGLQSTLAENTQLFNEYRIGQGIDGRAAEDAIGLRRLWQLAPGLAVSGTAEKIKPVSGKVADASQAVTAAIADTRSDVWKSSARLEWRESTQSQSWLATAATAYKFNDDWTALARGFYNVVQNRGGSTGAQHEGEFQGGFAYRPADNDTWNALGMIGYKRNQDSTQPVGQQVDQSAWIFLAQFEMQPAPPWEITTRFAAKHATDNGNGIRSSGWTTLVGGRVTRDIGERWDAGVQAFSSWGFGNRRNAAGVEVGYLVRRNFWLSMGYNVVGFNDPDLAGGAYTQEGFYLRFRFKFGADLFDSVGDMKTSRPQTNAAQSVWNGSAEAGHEP